MKILHIFPSFAIGGQQRRHALLANRLPDMQHVIVAIDGEYAAAGQLNEQVSWQQHNLAIRSGGGLLPANVRAFREALTRVRPDLLCTYNWGSIEAAVANRLMPFGKLAVPQIHFEDGFGPDETIDRQKWQRVMARRWFLRGRVVVVPSTGLKDTAVTKWGLNRGNVHHVRSGVDLEVFQPRDRAAGRRVVIGTVGALRPEKNIGRLIRLFHAQNLKDQARLVVAGDGPERAKLEQLVAELDLQADVAFVGHTDDPVKIYQDLDVFALTSDTEQMPFGVMEAMACGLPVVASAVGDVPSMVADENRQFVLPANDETAMASVLAKLVHSRSLRETVGAANLMAARQNFDLAIMVERFDRLFRETAGVSSGPGTH